MGSTVDQGSSAIFNFSGVSWLFRRSESSPSHSGYFDALSVIQSRAAHFSRLRSVVTKPLPLAARSAIAGRALRLFFAGLRRAVCTRLDRASEISTSAGMPGSGMRAARRHPRVSRAHQALALSLNWALHPKAARFGGGPSDAMRDLRRVQS